MFGRRGKRANARPAPAVHGVFLGSSVKNATNGRNGSLNDAQKREGGAARLTRRRTKSVLVGFLACTIFAIAADAFVIEPNWMEVTRHRVSAPVTSPLKIAHLTDVHTHGMGRREVRTLEILDAEKPDVIVITGDVIGDTSRDVLVYRRVSDFLRRLHAPLGVWVARGNWEATHPAASEVGFYRSVGAELLLNASRRLRDTVWIAGFDDCVAGRPDPATALRATPREAYVIAIFHAPQFFDQIAGQCDLALAGHTHGGQVRIPFYGPIWLPPGCGPYLAGWYEREGARLYVSRGIGTSLRPVRFACRPEIAFITLTPG
jgi:hypothetical protein